MISRLEHPKPQFDRENWQNLNGEWQFEIDNARCGEAKEFYKNDYKLNSKINIPFAPESPLSTIGNTDYMFAVWYKKTINITKAQLQGRVVLHFGAVDYISVLYINQVKVGIHKGGYTSFSFDITNFLVEGENVICLNAQDDPTSYCIATGKQDKKFKPSGVLYTRTTGVWQTVWLEFTPKTYIKSAKYYPNVKDGSVNITANLCGEGEFTVKAFYKGKLMATESASCNGGIAGVTLKLKEVHLWEPLNGRLYDLELSYGEDKVKSYFGLREVKFEGNKFVINGKSVFQRFVLDQGYYPDGIYTAPSDQALANDVKISIDAGFNGARLHQKVFEERFLYHCDKAGYMVWAEFPNWITVVNGDSARGILSQWVEEVERDFNHPAIIGWCPFNEVGGFVDGEWRSLWREPGYDFAKLFYTTTKSLDPTRPVNLISGGCHCVNFEGKQDITDVIDAHMNDYKEFDKLFESMPEKYFNTFDKKEEKVFGMPMWLSETGCIHWNEDNPEWNYNMKDNFWAPSTKEECVERINNFYTYLMGKPYMFGFCLVQLYDVEGELNGIYTYDRRDKFGVEKFKKVLSQKAAIED